MPIRAILKEEGVFTPEETQVLISAFEDTLRFVGGSNQSDTLSLFVARQVIHAASGGERDPVKLRNSVLSVLSVLGHRIGGNTEAGPT